MLVTKTKYESIKEEYEQLTKVNERLKRELQQKSTKIDTQSEDIEKIDSELRSTRIKLEDSGKELKDVRKALDDALEEISHLTKLIDSDNKENRVVMVIDDDLTTLRPTIRYTGEKIIDKLVENGYLDINQSDNKYSVQLALLLVAYEGIGTIVEEFSKTPATVKDNFDD